MKITILLIIFALVCSSSSTNTAHCWVIDLVNQVCTLCQTGYVIYNGSCVTSCPTNYAVVNNTCQLSATTSNSTTNGSIIIVANYSDVNCKTFSSNGQSCLLCYPSYYYSSTDAKCDPVNPLCKTITGINLCASCYGGYTLSNSSCIVSPTPTSSGDPNCKVSANGVCSQCYLGFYVNPSGVCAVSNPSCQTITSLNTCASCYSGYTLSNGDCIITTTVSGGAGDPNCKTSSNGVCSQCYQGFYVNPTTGICSVSNSNCQTITASNTCSSCYAGYTLSNGDCIITTTVSGGAGDPNCKTSSNGVCSLCYSGYYVNPTTGICAVSNVNCKTVSSLNACTSCYAGYTLSSGDCIIAAAGSSPTGDLNCQTVLNGVCTQCYIGYYVNPATGICSVSNTNCKTINSLNACTSCYFGYTLSSGSCIISGGATNFDPNCAQFQNGQCLVCSTRYYMTAQGCMLVDPQCKIWTSSGVCTQCYVGYALTSTGCSLQTSTSGSGSSSGQTTCYYRQVLVNGSCVQVNDQCQTWSSVNALCTSCYGGYTLQAGACIL